MNTGTLWFLFDTDGANSFCLSVSVCQIKWFLFFLIILTLQICFQKQNILLIVIIIYLAKKNSVSCKHRKSKRLQDTPDLDQTIRIDLNWISRKHRLFLWNDMTWRGTTPPQLPMFCGKYFSCRMCTFN